VRVPARGRGPAKDINRTARVQNGTLALGRGMTDNKNVVHLFWTGDDGEVMRFSMDAAGAALLAALLVGIVNKDPTP
jgi:hypothetical protein